MTTEDKNKKRRTSENEPIFGIIDKVISDDVLKKYHSKIGAFKHFHPMWMTIGDVCRVEYEPNKFVTQEEFKEMNIPLEEKKYLKETNVGFEDIDNSYLWDFKNKSEEDFDEIDKEFLKSEQNNDNDPKYVFTKHEFYGLHTYGGFHGFFRPDLNEVINLISNTVKEADLDEIERIYVTTDMYPSAQVNECYDSKTDRHKAKTTVYVVKRAN